MAPLAAAVAPDRVSARRQSLPHFVAHAPWSDARVLGKVRELVLPALERGGPVEAWIVDDTGLPRKGKHSVGVARQYRSQLGKQDNGQVAVSLSLASETASLPIAWRLYLPRTWARDAGRRRKAGRIAGARLTRLVLAIKTVLTLAIKKGGTTLRDFSNGAGKPGYFRHELQVYARAELPCTRCKTPIKLTRISQRATYYCPRCQR